MIWSGGCMNTRRNSFPGLPAKYNIDRLVYYGSSGFRVAAAVLYPLVHELLCSAEDSEISPPRRPSTLLRTGSGRRVKVFIKKYSELCVLGVSVVNLLSQ